jgi:hypothetical protein
METLNNYEKNENSFFSSISDSEFLFIFFQIKRHGCEMQLEVHMHYLILKNCTGYKIWIIGDIIQRSP